MSNDWDLSAIVRSCSSSAAQKAVARNTLEESFVFPDKIFNELSLSPFPVLIPTSDELDDPFDQLSRVYKPFYRRVQRQQQLLTTAAAAPVAADFTIGGSEYKRGRKRVQLAANSVAAVDVRPDSPINAAGEQEAPLQEQNQNGGAMRSQALRGRRRKQPRLVMKTNGESLSEDSWNWRKYGQKPIFGSMNPRSYYRCSSFKGCAARKQVELCANEPGMFIVTYIGDHTHRRTGGGGSDTGTPGNVSGSPISNDTPKPSGEAGNENRKQEDDDDIFMAMHAVDSTGSAFTGGQPQSPPKSVGTAGGFA